MAPILISIVVVLVVVFAAAIWMDRKRKHLGDTNTPAVMGKARRRTQLDGKERANRWGAGG